MAGPLSERGRILAPNLDDRRWKDLVDEARALIPKYAPQWTDHNPSDIGITLIELFAHMVEGLAYRLNRVPEKNYIAFLNLLGIKRDPATPARAFLTFKAPPGPTVLVPKGRQAQTQGTETEAPIFFETDEALTVLPINMPIALLVRKVVLHKYSNISSSYTQSPAEGETFTIPAGDSVQICLGFDLPTTLEIRLIVRLSRAVKIDPTLGPQATVEFLYSTGANAPTAWVPVPVLDDGTDGFTREGIVRITLPLGWTPQAPPTWGGIPPNSTADTVADPYHWIGIRIANTTGSPIKVGVASILFNSVSAHNALTIALPETLGTSDGKAFQVFPLANHPLFKRLETDTPYDHLQIQVGGVTWAPVEDFPAGPGDFYRVDPVASEISFGNHDPATLDGHGTVPPPGTVITAPTYRYVAGGTSGNVGAGTITSMRTPVPGIIGVTNLFSAYGGSDEEDIEDTKRRAPEALRNRHRAVTAEDYEYLAKEATTDVKIVRCLEPRTHTTDNPPAWNAGDAWAFAGLVRDPGNVFVIIVPDQGKDEPRPEPGIELVHEVQRFLDRRRDVTTRLQVTGPRYLPVKVNVQLHVWQQAIDAGLINTAADVQAQVEDAIELFLHPIHGNNGRGWQVGEHVYAPEIFRAVNPPEELGYLSKVEVEPQPPYPPYHDPPLGPGAPWLVSHRPFALPLGTPSGILRLTDYELACFGSHAVSVVVEA